MFENLYGMPILLVGFVLGILHSFDVDHIGIMSNFIRKSKNMKKSLRLGMFWGVGHFISLLLIGLSIIIFNIFMPKNFSITLEFIVSLILIILGGKILFEIFLKKGHFHKHTHNGIEHTHFHYHSESKSHGHEHRSLLVGLIHGLAGSAAIMLLVLASINSTFIGLMFILLFGIGSLMGMVLISCLVSIPIIYFKKNIKVQYFLQLIIGVFSISLGLNLIINLVI